MKETDNVIKDIEEFEVEELKHPFLGTYYMWKAGDNPKENMSPNTYYFHRRKILEVTGIDISIHPSEDSQNQEKRKHFSTRAAELPGFYILPFKRLEAE